MKKTSLILHSITLLSVAILFYLHFSGKQVTNAEVKLTPKKEANIVFVNSDSLLNNYKFYKKLKEDLESKNKKSESEIEQKLKKFEEEVQAYQQKAPSMTRDQMEAKETELKLKQQQLMQRREELGRQLADQEKQLTEKLFGNLTAYLKKINKENHNKYEFILGYSKAGGILYANDSLDITDQVIKGLNSDFEKQEKE